MKKLILFITLLIPALGFSQGIDEYWVKARIKLSTDSMFVIKTPQGTYDTLMLSNTSNGQVLQRVNGIWTNAEFPALGSLDSILFSTDIANLNWQEGKLYYDSLRGNLVFYDFNSEVGLDIGKEQWIDAYNNTGITITNGQVVFVDTVNGMYSTVELAKADLPTTADGVIGIATHDIENATIGRVTTFGIVRDINTSALTAGEKAYVSSTVAGDVVDARPEYPNYAIQIGHILISHADSGQIFVNKIGRIENILDNGWNGNFLESFDFRTTVNSGIIKGYIVRSDAADNLTMNFSDGFTLLDVSPADTIALTAGTDPLPQINYVYIPKTTKILTVSTGGFPSIEHIRISTLNLRSVATTLTDSALGNQNWNDHVAGGTGARGHILHISDWIRLNPAKYISGAKGTATIVGASSPDDIYISTTGGIISQMHPQSWTATDMQTGDDVHVFNDPVTAWKTITNLNTELTDASGNSLSGKSFSFVLWGIQNKTGEMSHMIINLPTNSYSGSSDAITDALGYSVYTIPQEFVSKSFLIARFTFSHSPGGGGTWTLDDTEDLTGKEPNTTAGGGVGGGGVTTFDQLTDVPNSKASQAGNHLVVSDGETALQYESPGFVLDASDTLVSADNVYDFVTSIVDDTASAIRGDMLVWSDTNVLVTQTNLDDTAAAIRADFPDVSITDNQVAIGTGTGIEGSSNLTWDLTTFFINGSGSVAGNWNPSVTDTYNLGTADLRWKTLYAQTSRVDSLFIEDAWFDGSGNAGISGAGDIDYIPKFTDTTTIANSIMRQYTGSAVVDSTFDERSIAQISSLNLTSTRIATSYVFNTRTIETKIINNNSGELSVLLQHLNVGGLSDGYTNQSSMAKLTDSTFVSFIPNTGGILNIIISYKYDYLGVLSQDVSFGFVDGGDGKITTLTDSTFLYTYTNNGTGFDEVKVGHVDKITNIIAFPYAATGFDGIGSNIIEAITSSTAIFQTDSLHYLTIESDNTITIETSYPLISINESYIDLLRLSDTMAVMVYPSSGIKAKIIDIDGTTLTVGSEQTISASTNNAVKKSLDFLTRQSNTRFTVSYIKAANDQGFSRTCDVSVTTITANDEFDFSIDVGHYSAAVFDSDEIAIVYANSTGLNNQFGIVKLGTIVGTDITYSTGIGQVNAIAVDGNLVPETDGEGYVGTLTRKWAGFNGLRMDIDSLFIGDSPGLAGTVGNNEIAIGTAFDTLTGESKNSAFNKDFGTTSGTVAEGDDARFHDAVTGSGTTNRGTKFVGVTEIGNSGILDTSTDTIMLLSDDSVYFNKNVYIEDTLRVQGQIIFPSGAAGLAGTVDDGYIPRGTAFDTLQNSSITDDGSIATFTGSSKYSTGETINKYSGDSTFIDDYNHNTVPTVKAMLDKDSIFYLTTYATDSLRTGVDTLFLDTHRNCKMVLGGATNSVFISGLTSAIEGYGGKIYLLQPGGGGATFVITNTDKASRNGDATYVFDGADQITVIHWTYMFGKVIISYGLFEAI